MEEKKKHAILFAEFVSNYPAFDDFWRISTEQQEKIYETFLLEHKDVNIYRHHEMDKHLRSKRGLGGL